MTQPMTPDTIPLTSDKDGVMRVGSSRVTLDTLVAAFREGMSAEGIVEQYPSLELGEVYSVIGYVIRHAQEVDDYLAGRQRHGEMVRQANEARFSPTGVRERLLARRHSR